MGRVQLPVERGGHRGVPARRKSIRDLLHRRSICTRGLYRAALFLPRARRLRLLPSRSRRPSHRVRTGQLNGDFTYGAVRDNQLRALNNIGFFTRDIGPSQDQWARWPNPLDESEPLELRARSYLAANCAHCHRPDGVSRADFDVRFSTPTETSRTVGISPSLGRLDAEPEQARIIQPGSADGSTLYLRTQNFSSFRMPPMGTSVLDQDGTDVLRRWIEGMSSPTSVPHRSPACKLHARTRLSQPL